MTPYDDKDSMKVLENYPDMVSVNHYGKKLMKNMNQQYASNVKKHTTR